MSKEFKFGSIVFTFVLIFLIVNMSFAWYTAKVNQGKTKELMSEGINIYLNTNEDNTLTPDVLKEGVLTVVGGEYVLPTDYEERKENDDTYYVESFGNTVTLVETVEIYLYHSDSVYFEFILVADNGEETNVSKYFDISYALVTRGGSVDNYTNTTNNESSLSVLVEELEEGIFDLYINISFNTVDELLPDYLLNSGVITLTVKGTLQ